LLARQATPGTKPSPNRHQPMHYQDMGLGHSVSDFLDMPGTPTEKKGQPHHADCPYIIMKISLTFL